MFGGVIVSFIVFAAIALGWIGYVPPVEELENPINKYASQVISSEGKWLGSYYIGKDNRINVTYSELSPDLVKGLISAEDIRYIKHSGIDFTGLVRAIVKTGILQQKSGGGGSTITQQLAKQLYSPGAVSLFDRVIQKPIEWVIAVRLERNYTKEEIVNLYLNKFDFLYNAVGIQSAARVYFGATPGTLKTEEAATLIGMCKNPSYYNPVRYNERARERRNMVLSQMKNAGYLDASVCDSLRKLPLELHFTRTDHIEGLAPYFREYLRLVMTAKKPVRSDYPAWNMQKFSEDSLSWETNPLYGFCNKNKKPNGQPYDLYTDGLKIYTTVDSRMQQYAEEAMVKHMSETVQPAFVKEKKGRKNAPFSSTDVTDEQIQEIMNRSIVQSDRYRELKKGGMNDADIRKTFDQPVEMRVFSWQGDIDTTMTPIDSIRYYKSFLRSSFMAMDPRTGHVKAYIGGIDFNSFKYDMVTTGRRQIGSTMKPFVYSLAMSEGFSPCDEVLHVQPHLYDANGIPWEPRNAGAERVGEKVTIEWGLQQSSNWVTAILMSKLSPYTLVRFLHSYGLQGNIDPVISMCLGTPDISLCEMVSAYSVFSNKGIRRDPLFVTRIENANGNTIATFTPESHEVLDELTTYKTLGMLRKVLDGGTGGRVRFIYGIRAPMGGKTGTSQNHSDGWFMGFTPSLVAGCWVGGDDRSIHFDTMGEGQGARMALPVYGLFMQKVYADKTLGYSDTENFDVPNNETFDCTPSGNVETSNNSYIDDFF
ncbi:MAG: transglycosylase domain-containing protein [Tannerella sp.]|jgi:penicillin-binding protein 1A|nr:transglycosylase domain-containing protein [Tannerella sp.]